MNDGNHNFNDDYLDALLERLSVFKQYQENGAIEEIAVNHLNEVCVRSGHAWRTEINEEITYDLLDRVGKALSNFSGKAFNRSHTSLSAPLPSGERIEMTHPPQSPEGIIYLNLRKHTSHAFPHEHLVKQHYYANVRHEFSLNISESRRKELYPYLTEDEKTLWSLITQGKFVEFMEQAVALYQNIIASGRTGSGKTAYLRSLVEMIDPDDRIITVEDTPEMPTTTHHNSQNLFYKKNGEDMEGATAEQVLHSVMRKTPTRVLLTELRGAEALFYLVTVLSSGHPGGFTSAHGNSPRDLFFRLALLIVSSESGKSLDMKTVLNLLHMTINVVVQLDFTKEKGRHITAIYYDPMYRLELVG